MMSTCRASTETPPTLGKSFKLGKLRGDKNINEPHLKSQSFFELVFNEIDEAVEPGCRTQLGN